ncbi:hypothetical protein HK105_200892 [Polyrhizophydium stewartii]|uniref:Uncharacterized protein n=1 Tax=Polyrhizophydium stewartii TaxID=2732419 RepID=A0ABR4NIH3_9FUNG
MVAKHYDANNLLRPWGLLHCDHCDSISCRDKNASIKMHLRVIFYLQHLQQFDAQGHLAVWKDGQPYLYHQQLRAQA